MNIFDNLIEFKEAIKSDLEALTGEELESISRQIAYFKQTKEQVKAINKDSGVVTVPRNAMIRLGRGGRMNASLQELIAFGVPIRIHGAPERGATRRHGGCPQYLALKFSTSQPRFFHPPGKNGWGGV